MALVDTLPDAQDTRTDWRPRVALGIAALSAISYVLVLVVPYYAAGAPDPSAPPSSDPLWAYPSVVGPVMGLLTIWALGVAPLACAAVAGWSGHRLSTTVAADGPRAVVWTALLVSVVTLVW